MSETEDLPSFSVAGQRENPTKTSISTRDFELVVDEPENMGGTDDGPTPLEYLLAAQAGCLNATAHEVAEDMGIAVNDIEIEIEGEFDPARFQGQSSDVRAGYQDVRVSIEADTDADDETLEQWVEQTEKRCPVTDNMQNSTPMDVSVTSV
jgi:uncharacterized OsmC-like protein